MMDQLFASTSASSSILPTVNLAASRTGRTPGKAHKATKCAVRRSYLSSAVKSSFHKRKELEKRREAIKNVEKEMKEEKEAEAERSAGRPSVNGV